MKKNEAKSIFTSDNDPLFKIYVPSKLRVKL